MTKKDKEHIKKMIDGNQSFSKVSEWIIGGPLKFWHVSGPEVSYQLKEIKKMTTFAMNYIANKEK